MADITIANTSIGDAQYVIPLESIDLIHLGKFIQNPHDKVQPIWSKKSLDGESEYFKIEVAEKDINDENDYFEPLETYLCHICDTDVPKINFKEHNDGKIHVANKDICDNVLNKLSKQTTVNIVETTDENANDYYCIFCCKGINKKNKNKHEKSNHHIKSVRNMEVLNKYCQTYIEKNDAKDLNTDDNNANYEITIQNSVNNDLPLNSNEDSEDEVQCFDANNATEHSSFKSYLEKMIKIYKLTVVLPFVDDNFIYIETPVGDVCKVFRNDFHSFDERQDYVYCQICRVSTPTDNTTHELSEIHVKNLFKPINDDFFRKIDDYTNHCLLCNTVVYKIDEDHHRNKDTHKIILRNTTVTDRASQRSNIRTKYCDICCVNIEAQSFDVHLESNKHITQAQIRFNMLKEIYDITKANKFLAKKQNNELYCNSCRLYLVDKDSIRSSKTKKSIVCNLCKINVSCSDINIHNAGPTHSAKLIEKLCTDLKNDIAGITNEMKIQNKKPITCSALNVKAPITKDENGSSGEPSTSFVPKPSDNPVIENKITLYRKLTRYENDAKTQIQCVICDVIIPNMDLNIIQHMNGKLHATELKELLEFHGIKKDPILGYSCQCCANWFLDFFDHINSNTHTDNYEKSTEINKELLKDYVYENDDHDGEAIQYRELYNNLLRSNNIVKLENSKFYCHICKIYMGRISEIDHVLGERHRSNKNA